ncbi:hypothetical protein BCT07_18145 [Vibrio breoganii]|uniref:HNH endonuclease n=1 Tax=Vibrio breoganii TaxID=553239 RepID=UPI000C843242|nr:HNH endonuclease [Vibrio breoganii]PMO52714.1 hypothetical protein BCT07_18145 [Vibrio breoganii]
MRNKSAYHKTYEMKPFDGKYFYSKKGGLLVSDYLYVFSSKGSGGSGRTLTPYLEGKFKVIDIVLGDFTLGSTPFSQRATLETIFKPSEPINLCEMQDYMGTRAFASRFLNQPKPLLTQDEVKQFDSLLKEENSSISVITTTNLSDDIKDILDSDTEREALIMARIGQGKFRKSVSTVWGYHREVCAATLIDIPSILTASHIIPWRECTGENAALRWDGTNGILLCAHLDRLFDRYLMSFKKSGNSCSVRYSKTISDNIKIALNLTDELEVVPNLMSKNDKERFFYHMEQHYLRFIENEKHR